jgi:hypothetical protein
MSKRDGPITRQKARIEEIAAKMREHVHEVARLRIQLDEANAALAMLTGKPVERTEPTEIERPLL